MPKVLRSPEILFLPPNQPGAFLLVTWRQAFSGTLDHNKMSGLLTEQDPSEPGTSLRRRQVLFGSALLSPRSSCQPKRNRRSLSAERLKHPCVVGFAKITSPRSEFEIKGPAKVNRQVLLIKNRKLNRWSPTSWHASCKPAAKSTGFFKSPGGKRCLLRSHIHLLA